MGRMSVGATLASAPFDQKLWDEATRRKEHISQKEVSDEYDRLILKKHGIDPKHC